MCDGYPLFAGYVTLALKLLSQVTQDMMLSIKHFITSDRQFDDIIIVIYIRLDTFNWSQLGCQVST